MPWIMTFMSMVESSSPSAVSQADPATRRLTSVAPGAWQITQVSIESVRLLPWIDSWLWQSLQRAISTTSRRGTRLPVIGA